MAAKDVSLTRELGIHETPTVFISGVRFNGLLGAQQLRVAHESARRRAPLTKTNSEQLTNGRKQEGRPIGLLHLT